MKNLFLLAVVLMAGASIGESATLESGFAQPPPVARPWVFWMWLRCEEEYSPVILDVVGKGDYPDFTAFQQAILAKTPQRHGSAATSPAPDLCSENQRPKETRQHPHRRLEAA